MRKRITVLTIILCLSFAFFGCANYSAPDVKISHNRIAGGKINVIIGAVYELEVQLTKTEKDIDPELKVEWSSSDSNIVKVDGSGKIQGRKAGKATVIAAVQGKQDSVEVTVSYGFQLPASTLSSTARSTNISTNAFDRKDSTMWISDITKATDEETEWLQACYNEPREVEKIVVKMHENADYALPVKVELFGLANMLDDSGEALGYALGAQDSTFTVVLAKIGYYSNYRVVFSRGDNKKDFAVCEVEIWSPQQLTK